MPRNRQCLYFTGSGRSKSASNLAWSYSGIPYMRSARSAAIMYAVFPSALTALSCAASPRSRSSLCDAMAAALQATQKHTDKHAALHAALQTLAHALQCCRLGGRRGTYWTMDISRSMVARCSGVFPSRSVQVVSAPASIKHVASCACPREQARINGVEPLPSVAASMLYPSTLLVPPPLSRRVQHSSRLREQA